MKGNKALNWNEYQQQALSTAIYPLKRELEYTAFGLVSELGELNEVYVESKSLGWGFSQAALNSFLKEAGDCYWYLAAVADALNVSLQHIWEEYAPLTNYRPLKSRGMLLLVLGGRGAQIAGIVKKAIRDNDGFLSDAGAEAIKCHLGYLMLHLNELVDLLGGTPEGVTANNLNKLADRKKRGVLQGSGDNR
jgi:NTP pyrophosphatase (non-canonical NTP hydrolase)